MAKFYGRIINSETKEIIKQSTRSCKDFYGAQSASERLLKDWDDNEGQCRKAETYVLIVE